MAPVAAVLPFWLLALLCWGMTFTLSAPRSGPPCPACSLLQFPWRLLGPLALCLAVAVAGSFVPLLRSLEGQRRRAAGRRAGWLLLGALTLAVALNGAGDRPLPLDDLDGAARRVDGTNVVSTSAATPRRSARPPGGSSSPARWTCPSSPAGPSATGT